MERFSGSFANSGPASCSPRCGRSACPPRCDASHVHLDALSQLKRFNKRRVREPLTRQLCGRPDESLPGRKAIARLSPARIAAPDRTEVSKIRCKLKQGILCMPFPLAHLHLLGAWVVTRQTNSANTMTSLSSLGAGLLEQNHRPRCTKLPFRCIFLRQAAACNCRLPRRKHQRRTGKQNG